MKSNKNILICTFPNQRVELLDRAQEDERLQYVVKVLSSGSSSFVSDGDYIIFYIEKKLLIDGTTHNMWTINGEKVLSIPDAFVQAVVTNHQKAKEYMDGMNVNWDHGVDTKAAWKNVIVELIPPKSESAAGLIIPKFEMGRNQICQLGKILSVGQGANNAFCEHTLEEGQIVMVKSFISGGLLPSKPDQTIWRTNSENILGVFNGQDFVPTGGNCLVKPYTLRKEVSLNISSVEGSFQANMIESEGGLLIPTDTTNLYRMGHIVSIGHGWSREYLVRRDFYFRENEKGTSFEQFQVGDKILMDFFNHEGVPTGEIYPSSVGGELHYFLNSIMINVRFAETENVNEYAPRKYDIPSHQYRMTDIKPLQK